MTSHDQIRTALSRILAANKKIFLVQLDNKGVNIRPGLLLGNVVLGDQVSDDFRSGAR